MVVMEYPVSVDENGVNFNPDNMEKEKLYHCIFKVRDFRLIAYQCNVDMHDITSKIFNLRRSFFLRFLAIYDLDCAFHVLAL